MSPSAETQLDKAVSQCYYYERMNAPSRTHHVASGSDKIEHRLHGLGINSWISSDDFLKNMIIFVPLNVTIWLYQIGYI